MQEHKEPKQPKPLIPNLYFVILLITLFLNAVIVPQLQNARVKEVSYNVFMDLTSQQKIDKVQVDSNQIIFTEKGQNAIYKTGVMTDPDLTQRLYNAGADFRTDIVHVQTPMEKLLYNWVIPIIIMMIFWQILSRQFSSLASKMGGGMGGGLGGSPFGNFGKSNVKEYVQSTDGIHFHDVAGEDEAKESLQEIVQYLKDPSQYTAIGAQMPKGILLVGPPGTGKTLLAKAVAGESNVPFFSISGSEFVEMFVGVGASRVRDLFQKAKKNAPAIVFIDEIDAVGRKRGSGMGGGHDEREQTLNQILVEMDGFEADTNVIVIAATNRADVLDPALLRPGRFDRHVTISLPERKDREAILKVHFKNKPTDDTVDLDKLAAKTAGSSGADLANIANEAAIIAARRNSKKVSNDDLTEAFEKVAIGPERKAKVMNDHEKELTAYHEAGHAIVGHVLPDSDPVHKITIIPRGGTGGVTWFLPPEDRSYTNVYEFKDILARALGGRIAEKLIYGNDGITTGAGSDLRHAAKVARNMIVEQGMGSKLRDQVFHEDNGGMVFDKITHDRPYSEATAQEIDNEVEALIKEASVRAETILSKNRAVLEKLKDALLKNETLEEEDAAKYMKDAVLPKEVKLHA